MPMDSLCYLFISYNILFFFCKLSQASDTITSSQYIVDGKTLVSGDGSFEVGFFSPGISRNRYLGIWYKNIPGRTVVWVANGINPINDSSGLLIINSTGHLVLMSQKTNVVWSTTLRKEAKNSAVLQLLNSGNLVLRDVHDNEPGSYLWQSFDYPSDTFLPGMKLGWDFRSGIERRVTSWKSSDDPSPGDFSWGIPLQDNPETVMRKGSEKFFRSGPWNGLSFSGAPSLRPNPVFNFSFVNNEDELYYTFSYSEKSIISRAVMNQTILRFQRMIWNEEMKDWKVYAYVPRDYCDTYALCGAYGNCVITESPVCQCLKGFKPKSSGYVDWSQGCERNKPLNYSRLDGFVKFDGLKLPDATHSWVNRTMNLKECKEKCLQNSSCMAYANSDIRGRGSGCALWYGDLIDMRQFQDGGQNLYIRMSASELGSNFAPRMIIEITLIAVSTIAVVGGVIMVGCFILRRRNSSEETENKWTTEQKSVDMELPTFDLDTIASATNNFDSSNKLGEGGFGPVYKGILMDGQEIAVKRLSKLSGQGINEFKNEVILISKLQHRNLVKLLGCCIQGDEKMLIYEFMPNKSLDFFIFDQSGSKLLDWSKRFQIICGVARGLLYLHQDSRLRIIHRDMKASNVLLDHDMNPKISDFGLARTFGGEQTEGSTNRVVGTYGYMAPEYAIDGTFSVKSDVFSFGILLLEIVSGRKSKGFCHPNHKVNLIGHAWKCWMEDHLLEFIDLSVRESCNQSEAVRCIHISLLCVQQQPDDRPSMSTVVLMLGSETDLPEPKQPGFLLETQLLDQYSSSSKPEFSSSNEITMSVLQAR